MMRRGLRLPHLRLIIALHDTGQISGAAHRMGMTQPAASRLLAELEQATGTPLYTRHARGVVLTEAGTLLARRSKAALHDLDDAFDDIGLLTAGAGGMVRIGTVTGPGLEIVLPTIRDIRVTYPEIAFTILVDTSDKLATALVGHEIDFYLGRLPAGFDPAAVTMRPIGTEPISLVVRDNHPLLRRHDLHLSECLAHDWVLQPPGGLMRMTVEDYLLKSGLPQPARVLNTSSLLLTLALVSETNAIAPIATSVADLYANEAKLGSRIRRLDVAQDMQVATYALIGRNPSRLNAAAERVLARIVDRIDTAAILSGN